MSNKIKNIRVARAIRKVKRSGSGTLTLHFHNGSKKVTNININIFKDNYGKDIKLPELVRLFNDIQEDEGAKYYRIN